MSKRPSFQFYPSDWRNDPGLRLCSIGARGLWIEMLCLMHEGQPYGSLTVQGRAIDAPALARLVGESPTSVKRWMKELADNEVYSVADDGTIFSRRMVRDEDLRERRAEIGRANGHKGAEFGHRGSEHGKKGGRPRRETPVDAQGEGVSKPPQEPPQNPRPSSSSSSSSSEPAERNGSGNRARGQAAMPADVRSVLEEGGFISPPPDLSLLREWYDAGATLEQDILPTVRRLRASASKAPFKLKFFDAAIREKLAEDAAEAERLTRIARRIEAADREQAAGGPH